MQILLNEQNYVTSYMMAGEIVGGYEIEAPENLEHFEDNFYGYRYDGANLVFDENKAKEISNAPSAPTQLDAIEAQVAYTAMITGTLLEV